MNPGVKGVKEIEGNGIRSATDSVKGVCKHSMTTRSHTYPSNKNNNRGNSKTTNQSLTHARDTT